MSWATLFVSKRAPPIADWRGEPRLDVLGGCPLIFVDGRPPTDGTKKGGK